MRETILVGVLAFVAGVVLYPAFIGLLVRSGARQHVASYSPASHRAKEGTPTLGGAAVLPRGAGGLARGRPLPRGIRPDLRAARRCDRRAASTTSSTSATSQRLGLSVWQKLGLQGVTGVLVGVGLTIAGFHPSVLSRARRAEPRLGTRGRRRHRRRRHQQRRQPDRRCRRTRGHRARSLVLVGITIIAVTRWRLVGRDHRGGARRRRRRVPALQLVPGAGVHGRCRIARAGQRRSSR